MPTSTAAASERDPASLPGPNTGRSRAVTCRLKEPDVLRLQLAADRAGIPPATFLRRAILRSLPDSHGDPPEGSPAPPSRLAA